MSAKSPKGWIAALLPARALEWGLSLRDRARCRRAGVEPAPLGTDGVGYEGLIAFIERARVLDRPGDVVEIGTLLGGGALKLSAFLERRAPSKRLFVIDTFVHPWERTSGDPVENLYLPSLRRRYAGLTQRQVFDRVTAGRRNMSVLAEDSKKASLPEGPLCFGFIDGDHEPSYVENDFELVWRRLVPGGVAAFHDYRWYLPSTTEKIEELTRRHSAEIGATSEDSRRHILYVVKR